MKLWVKNRQKSTGTMKIAATFSDGTQGLFKINEPVTLIGQSSFFFDAISVIRKRGNIKGFFLSVYGKNHDIFCLFSGSGIFRNDLYFVFINDNCRDRFDLCMVIPSDFYDKVDDCCGKGDHKGKGKDNTDIFFQRKHLPFDDHLGTDYFIKCPNTVQVIMNREAIKNNLFR